jgi:hypothetical protein
MPEVLMRRTVPDQHRVVELAELVLLVLRAVTTENLEVQVIHHLLLDHQCYTQAAVAVEAIVVSDPEDRAAVAQEEIIKV